MLLNYINFLISKSVHIFLFILWFCRNHIILWKFFTSAFANDISLESFTGVWITASLHKSPRLFFWSTSRMQLSGWSQLVFWFLILQDSSQNTEKSPGELGRLDVVWIDSYVLPSRLVFVKVFQVEDISYLENAKACPPISNFTCLFTESFGDRSKCLTVTIMFHRFFSSLVSSKNFSAFSFSLIFSQWLSGKVRSWASFLFFFFFFFFLLVKLSLGLVGWLGLSDLFIAQNPREFCASQGQILVYAYTICSYGQISISCTIPCGSPSPLSRVFSYSPFELVRYIRFLCK